MLGGNLKGGALQGREKDPGSERIETSAHTLGHRKTLIRHVQSLEFSNVLSKMWRRSE